MEAVLPDLLNQEDTSGSGGEIPAFLLSCKNCILAHTLYPLTDVAGSILPFPEAAVEKQKRIFEVQWAWAGTVI